MSEKTNSSLVIYRTKTSPRAFTLIETIMVLTMFSIVAAGLAGALISGLRLWQRAKSTDFSYYEDIFAFERMAKEMRQSFDLKQIPFSGDLQKVTFPSISGTTIKQMTYWFDPLDGSFYRGEADLKDILSGQEELKYPEKKLGVFKEFKFSYFYYDKDKKDFFWTEKWESANGIFKALKIEAKDSNNREHVKTIFIPVS